jgi:hypothetical protein
MDTDPVTDRDRGELAERGWRELTNGEAELSDEALDEVAGGGAQSAAAPPWAGVGGEIHTKPNRCRGHTLDPNLFCGRPFYPRASRLTGNSD